MTKAGYRYLASFQLAEVIYTLTLKFLRETCLPAGRFGRLGKLGRRQREQMEQAARSGKQNIAEGYSQGTSLKAYIKLLGVARGSLEELKLDFEDFLKNNNLPIWDKNHPRIREFRKYRVRVIREVGEFGEIREKYNVPNLPNDPTEAANLIITLISQCSFLLKRQIESLIDKHMREGGFTEKLYQRRIKYRRTYHEKKN